jgi:putative transposase
MIKVSQANIESQEDTMDSNSLSHTKWECKYHIVFIPKYRRKTMYDEKRDVIREILRKLCEYKQVEIIEGAVCPDHIHLCLKIPPKLSVSDFMGYLKGKSALMFFDRFPEKQRYDRHLWARGYYVSTVGRDEVQIRKYIVDQTENDKLDDSVKK